MFVGIQHCPVYVHRNIATIPGDFSVRCVAVSCYRQITDNNSWQVGKCIEPDIVKRGDVGLYVTVRYFLHCVFDCHGVHGIL